jgi:hypothetical protein
MCERVICWGYYGLQVMTKKETDGYRDGTLMWNTLSRRARDWERWSIRLRRSGVDANQIWDGLDGPLCGCWVRLDIWYERSATFGWFASNLAFDTGYWGLDALNLCQVGLSVYAESEVSYRTCPCASLRPRDGSESRRGPHVKGGTDASLCGRSLYLAFWPYGWASLTRLCGAPSRRDVHDVYQTIGKLYAGGDPVYKGRQV